MPNISQKMELKQQLSPQQVLQASLLQLNLPLLEQRIMHELENNPALEMIELPPEVEVEDEIPEVENQDTEEEIDWEELFGQNDDYEYPQKLGGDEEKREIPLISRESFSERIIKQLRDCNVEMEGLKIAEEVVGNLDEQGYLTIEPALISDRLEIKEQDVLEIMHKIQGLDPPGLAARNLRECLLAQAEVRDENSVAVMILKDCFDDFANHRYEKILDKLNCSKDELNEAMEFIARLNPSPRDDQPALGENIVIPDIAVEDRGGGFQVVVHEGLIPEVRVSKTYLNMLNDYKDKKDVLRFVKKKLESAKWFVDAVEQRKNTIQRVMESIIKHQPDYFQTGGQVLKPMVLKDIAEDINMDISTVSRVTNGKYAQLPWEIKELKSFFSEGIQTDKGKAVSNVEVKNRLNEIIETEDKQKPIGDEELTSMLNSEGYKIARRTITKYREQLKYPTARLRRKLK